MDGKDVVLGVVFGFVMAFMLIAWGIPIMPDKICIEAHAKKYVLEQCAFYENKK